MSDSPDPTAPREELPPASEPEGSGNAEREDFQDVEDEAFDDAEPETFDDEMFLLRYRDPVRYGKWTDRTEARQHPEGPVWMLAYRLARLLRAVWDAFDAAMAGPPPPEPRDEVTE
jgi:hypothetical protein